MGKLSDRLSPAGQALVAQGAEKRDAADLLRERGIPCRRVVRVDPYAVAYESPDGEVVTAWLVWLDERQRLVVWTTPGLPAFP